MRARGFQQILTILAVVALALATALAHAQPSGGPYGPILQRYEIPKAAHVYYVAPDGDADVPGTALDRPTTLEAAIARVVTGDAIVLRGGVYRTGGLLLNQGITLQPYADERPVLKGTQLATQWEALPRKLWRTSWARLFPARPLGWWQRAREGMRTPLHRFNNDMVFVDGRLLRSAGWEGEVDENSYYVDYDAGRIYIGVDPQDRLVEITAHDSAVVRTSGPCHGKTSDRRGPLIRGLTFTQYAFRALEIEGKTGAAQPNQEPTNEPLGPADPATYGKEVTGTTLENVTISYCSRVAGYFRGDWLDHPPVADQRHLDRGHLRDRLVRRAAGAEHHPAQQRRAAHRLLPGGREDLQPVAPRHLPGQPGDRAARLERHLVRRGQPRRRLRRQLDRRCRRRLLLRDLARGDRGGQRLRALRQGPAGAQLVGVRVYNNTFVDTPASFERNERSAVADHFGWHAATGPDVAERDGHVFANNLLVASESYRGPLLRFEQPKALCERLAQPQVKDLDGNVYVRASIAGAAAPPLVVWSPAATDSCLAETDSLEALRGRAPRFESSGRQIDSSPRSVFKGPDLGRYELLRGIPGTRPALPVDVRKLLGWSERESLSPGAYPFRP